MNLNVHTTSVYFFLAYLSGAVVRTDRPVTVLHYDQCNAEFSLPACSVQVKTLKPLSTLKLQQLIGLMEEESFKNEEYIATEGQLGEKFFIVVLGTVRTLRPANKTARACVPGPSLKLMHFLEMPFAGCSWLSVPYYQIPMYKGQKEERNEVCPVVASVLVYRCR